MATSMALAWITKEKREWKIETKVMKILNIKVIAGLTLVLITGACKSKQRKEIDEAFGNPMNLEFEQTEDSKLETRRAAIRYEIKQLELNKYRPLRERLKAERVVRLEAQKARDEAMLSAQEQELAKLGIEGNGSMDKVEKVKALKKAKEAYWEFHKESKKKDIEIRYAEEAIHKYEAELVELKRDVARLEAKLETIK